MHLLFHFLIASSAINTGPAAPSPSKRATSAHTAAQVGTVAIVIAAANEVLAKLQNVGTALTGDASIAVGGAAGQMSQLIAQLERVAGQQINVPMASLGMDVRVVATQLQQTTNNLNALVDRQRGCIFANLDLFLAGVSTVSADLKRGIPFVSTLDPRLISFQFDSRQTPNVVPQEGGRTTIRGYRLWTDGFTPTVALWNAGRDSKLADLAVGAANSEHAVSVNISPTLIRNNVGECLQLAVQTYRKKRVLGGVVQYGREPGPRLVLPMCVPIAYGTQVALEAQVNYTVGVPGRREVSSKRFAFRNPDMKNRMVVNETKAWGPDEIPAGWQISEVLTNVVKRENDSNVQVNFVGNSVTATGWLSDAEDIRTGGIFGPRIKVDDTEWIADVTPIITGATADHRESKASSELVNLTLPGTRVCVRPSIAGAPDPISTVQVTLRQTFNGSTTSAPLFQSTRLNTNANPLQHQEQAGAYMVTVNYNPTVVGGTCEVCATLGAMGQCGF